jgi:hypothetical protein
VGRCARQGDVRRRSGGCGLACDVFLGAVSADDARSAEVTTLSPPSSTQVSDTTFLVPPITSSLPAMDDRLVLLAEGNESTVVRDEPGRWNLAPHWVHTPDRRFFGASGERAEVEDGGKEVESSLHFLVGELVPYAADAASAGRLAAFRPSPARSLFLRPPFSDTSTSTTLGSFFTLTTFQPNPSLSAPHLSQHHLRAASGGRSRISLTRAACRAESGGESGWRRDGTAGR